MLRSCASALCGAANEGLPAIAAAPNKRIANAFISALTAPITQCHEINLYRVRAGGARFHMLHLAKHCLDAGEQLARGAALKLLADDGAARLECRRSDIECGFEQNDGAQMI